MNTCVAANRLGSLGRRALRISSLAADEQGPVKFPLHNRVRELGKLGAAFQKRPAEILVILGPRSCGKTATMMSHCTGKLNVAYINCRGIDARNPASFISALLDEVLPRIPTDVQQMVLDTLATLPMFALRVAAGLKITEKTASEDVAVSLAGLPKAISIEKNTAALAGDLNALFKMLRTLLDGWANTIPGSWPVIVIDEANELMGWDKYPEELATLLKFFVLITKEQRRCHVLMVTSEFGYQAWLSKAIGPGFWAPEVIGDFEESDAREYLKAELLSLNSSSVLDDAAWAKVYEVCGGNVGALVRLTLRIDLDDVRGDWDAALRMLWRIEAVRVKALARGSKGYTAAQYAVAAVLLLDSKHHAVDQDTMQLQLGSHVVGAAASEDEVMEAGDHVVQRMVEVNALSVRPISSWARDIPAEAFDNEGPVVTAPSTMDLYCMKRLRPHLDKVLTEWKQKQEAGMQGIWLNVWARAMQKRS